MSLDKTIEEFIRELWGEEKPIYVFCPICDGVLSLENPLKPLGKKKCEKCNYTYQSQGSYASLVTIKEERFYLDDMFGDSEKLRARISELNCENH